MKKNIIIVGSGVVGLLAAYKLSKKFNVTILEKGKKIGGLYSSTKKFKQYYDFGCHIPSETGNSEIDNFFFNGIKKNNYNIISGNVLEGSFFKSKLNKKSGLIDARNFDKNITKYIKKSITKISKINNHPNLEKKIINEYGKVLYNYVYKDIIKKISNVKINKLNNFFLEDFYISRLIIFNQYESKILKKNIFFDKKIGYPKRALFKTSNCKYYPKKGGSMKWINFLINKLKLSNVKIIKNTFIKKIYIEKNKIRKIMFNQEKIKCDYLIWTPSMFQLPIKYQKVKNLKKPSMRNIILFHFILDRKLDHKLHLLNVYDDRYLSYRITFYNNLQGLKYNSSNVITVEIISDITLDTQHQKRNLKNKIFNELIEMKIISDKSKIINYFFQILRNSIVFNSNQNLVQIGNQRKILEKQYSNLILGGKANTNLPTIQTYVDILNKCKNLISNSV